MPNMYLLGPRDTQDKKHADMLKKQHHTNIGNVRMEAKPCVPPRCASISIPTLPPYYLHSSPAPTPTSPSAASVLVGGSAKLAPLSCALISVPKLVWRGIWKVHTSSKRLHCAVLCTPSSCASPHPPSLPLAPTRNVVYSSSLRVFWFCARVLVCVCACACACVGVCCLSPLHSFPSAPVLQE